ncbi:MAG: SDR family NAD(P)-dependent oxidoreductase [Hyphomicrobiaceae bacterium]|nr:SDR family NAD(P)-dependent oxidoreductase [Hyphomicrobiaceae bacterium]
MTQRTILITGCSTGIGLEAAKSLKHRGWRVIGTARKAADRANLETSIGIETVTLELGDLASVAACATEVLARTNGTLDALYNNAAFGQIGAMEDVTGAVLRHHFDVNVIGTHELTRLLIPTMRQQGHGRIVTCSSVLGLVSGPYRGPYSATKFAVEAMTDALRYELYGSGIHVSLLEPGPIVSNFLDTTISTFKSSIDVANSPHRAAYEKRLRAMETDTQSKWKTGPEVVVKSLIHALESQRPKIRYRISPHTYAIVAMKRILPQRIIDAIMVRT